MDDAGRDAKDSTSGHDWAELEPWGPSMAGSPSPHISRVAGAARENLTEQLRQIRQHHREAEFWNVEGRVMRFVVDPVRLLSYGVPAVLAWVVSVYAKYWNEALGDPLGAWEGYVRLGLMLLGAALTGLAWPRYIRRDTTVEQHDADLAARDRFSADMNRRLRR